MKEKFTKLFGALILVALMLGLVLPFQTASAEEITTADIVGVVASQGVTGKVFTPGNGYGPGTPGANEITVAWKLKTAAPATDFKWILSRSDTESGPKAILGNNIVSTTVTYTDTLRTPGKRYFYWVQMTDASSTGSYFGTSGWAAVPQVAAVAQKADYEQVILTMTDGYSLPAGGFFEVYRAEDAGTEAASWPADLVTYPLANFIGTTATLVYNDKTAVGQTVLADLTKKAAGSYYYKVDACGVDYCASENEANTDNVPGNFSYVKKTSTVVGRTVVAAPAFVTATDGTVDKKVTVSWSANADVVTWYAQRTLSGIKVFEPVPAVTFVGATLTGDDIWAVGGTSYDYYIWGCSVGTANCSEPKFNAGFHSGYAAVSGLTATDGTYSTAAGAAGIKVAFTALTTPGVSKYNLYRSDDAAGLVNIATYSIATGFVAGSPVSYEDLSVSPGQTYYYWVKACGTASGSYACGSASNIDSGWAPLPKVTGLTLVNSTAGVSAVWTASSVSGVTYKGFRSPNTTFASAIPVAGIDIPTALGTSGTDTSGTVGVNYWYFIKACLGDKCSAANDGVMGTKLP